jgi:hypothetical protein
LESWEKLTATLAPSKVAAVVEFDVFREAADIDPPCCHLLNETAVVDVSGMPTELLRRLAALAMQPLLGNRKKSG